MATIKRKEEPKTEDELYAFIDKKIQTSIGNTQVWENNQDKWHKMRMRIKKAKTFPFVGCSNIRMPTLEIKIRKVKAALVNVIFGIRPVVQVIPSPQGKWETAQKIEKFLDHLIMDIIKVKPKAIVAIDQTLEKGFYLLKPFWNIEINTRTENYSLDDLSIDEALQLYDLAVTPEMMRKGIIDKFDIDMADDVAEDNEIAIDKAIDEILAGKTEIELIVQDVLYNFPDVALCSPERVYAPTDGGYNPQELTWICHEFFMPINKVKDNARFKGWDMEAVNDITSYQGATKDSDWKEKLTDISKDQREGIERLNNASELVKIREWYGWHDLKGKDDYEKVVITLAPEFSKTLNKRCLPFDNGMFPFVKTYYELTDDRWFSHRGLPEIIEDIVKEIDIQHMQKIDQQTIRNAPMFVYRAGMINPNLVQFIPNQGIPVNGANPLRDTIDVLNNNNPNVEYSYDKEQMILESKIEELVGQIDFTLQSMINKRQPRTLGEVNQQVQNMQMVFSLDADMFIENFALLFNWIWDLWCQHGEDEYEFKYFGMDAADPRGETIKLTKEEIQGKYKITVRGNDQNTNPQVKQQKASQILQAVTNPVLLQSGVVSPQHMANGLKRFYQTLDVQDWENFVNPNPQPPPQPTLADRIPPDFDELEEGEQAQVLISMGIRPDIAGRLLSKQEELSDNAAKNTKTTKQ
jgi:hypothetical protein